MLYEHIHGTLYAIGDHQTYALPQRIYNLRDYLPVQNFTLLTNEYLLYGVSSKNIYDQIRLLDETGMGENTNQSTIVEILYCC